MMSENVQWMHKLADEGLVVMTHKIWDSKLAIIFFKLNPKQIKIDHKNKKFLNITNGCVEEFDKKRIRKLYGPSKMCTKKEFYVHE